MVSCFASEACLILSGEKHCGNDNEGITAALDVHL